MSITMSIRAKFILAIVACLSLTMYLGGAYLQKLQTDILEQEAHNRIKIVLNFTHATRSYVDEKLRPVLEAELQNKMILEGMSATFMTRSLIEIFRKTMPNYLYKQATLNPLNLVNQADDFEAKLIQTFQKNPELQETTGYRHLNNEELFYFAQPIRVKSHCLQCHSEPLIAPQEIIARYGNTHGFYWKNGEIVSALMLYVPTKDLHKQATILFNALLTAFVLLTLVIIGVVYILFERLVNRRLQKITQVMEQTASHSNHGIQLVDIKSLDEIGRMSIAFNQMSQQLKNSIDGLEDKNQQLEQVNQLKNEFLAIAAHDLKNPLSIIQALSEEIATRFDDMKTEEVLEYILIIQTTSHQTFELINNLLEVNAIESDKMPLTLEMVNLKPIIFSILSGYERQTQIKDIKIHLELADYCEAYVDEILFRQVLDNLVSNALKYSYFHSEIIIRLKQLENTVSCEIQDQGQGLSTADQEKLFNKFTRLTPRPTADEHSTGLGLFIVKKLVEAMDGQVSCRSELGKGSTFIVELQRHPPAVQSEILSS